MMTEDAIRILAAAMCSDTKKTKVDAVPDPALRPIIEFVMLMSGYVQISVSGKAEVDPLTRIPNISPLRLYNTGKEVFLLLAGVMAKLNIVFLVQEVEGGVTTEELQTLSDAMGGILVFAENEKGIYLSSFSTRDSLVPEVPVSPIFAAGALVGATLGFCDTRFRLGDNRNAPEVRCAIDAINACGGTAIENEDGTVTVKTTRDIRFNRKTGKRIRKRAK